MIAHDDRFDDLEAEVRLLRRRLELLERKVYDIPDNVRIIHQNERTLENIGDEIDAKTSEFMDMVEAIDRGE